MDADTLGSSVQRGIAQGGEAGIGALQPALLGVGITMAAGVASALSGVAGLIPAGLLGAGGVIGTLATGLNGVKDAWDSSEKAAQSSGTEQAAKAKEVASAQRSLHDAVVSEEQAQKDVATARKDALRQLRDLNLEMRGGALDEKQATLDAQAARRDLATGRFKDSIEYQQAQLRVEEADQRVAEVHQRNIDLQAKGQDMQAKGVDNADGVVRANQNLARTQEQVAAAQQNVADATNKVSSAQQTAMQDWAKLAPNAQAFLGVLQTLKPMWDELQKTVQNNLFAGVGEQIQQLATTYLPMLQGFMGGMATTMSQAFGQLSQWLQQPQTMAAMQSIFANIGQSFQIWTQAMQPFSDAFLRVTQVGSTFLPQLAQMVVQVADAFNQWAQSGQLGEWIQTGMTALQQLGTTIQTLLPMFGALAPIGTATLGALNTVLTALQPAIAPLAGVFASLIGEITPGLGILGQLISQLVIGLAPAFTQLFIAMTPVAQQIAGILSPVLAQLGPVLAQISAQVGAQLAVAIQQLTPLLIPMVQQFAQLLQDVIPLLPQLMAFSGQALPAITAALTLMIPWTTQMMKFIDTLVTKVPGLISPLLGLASALEKVAGTGDKMQWLMGPLGKVLSLLPGGDSGATPAAVTPSAGSGFNWDAVAQAESSGNWQDNNSGGHTTSSGAPRGGLQITDQTWAAFGGKDFAPSANLATKDQQIEVANRIAFTGYNGTPPQGLGAWETITKGMVPGVTTSSQPSLGGLPGAQAERRGTRGSAGWGFTPGFQAAPVPSSGVGGGLSSTTTPTFSALPPVTPAITPAAAAAALPPGDAALLANVPAGRYTQAERGDLTQGLADCSSAVEDLVNIMQGRPTGGATMYTGNEAQWLTSHGFVPTNAPMPGTFQVGFNPNHTQATLPGGTNFNWGSDASAANRGVGGTGAWDPAFTQHYYLPNTPGMPQGVSGVGGPTGSSTDPYYMQYPDGYKPPGPDMQQLGQQMGGDIWDMLLPEGFKNPTQFGGWKLFTGLLSGLTGINGKGKGSGQGMPASYWAGGDGASQDDPSGGGGGGGGLFGNLLGGILGIKPQPVDNLKAGSPGDAPGQFMPAMPTATDTAVSPFGSTGAGGTAGPGNNGQVIDNKIVINNPVGQDHLTNMVNTATQAQVPRVRQGVRPLP